MLDANKLTLVTKRESEKDMPNYWLKNLKLRMADRQLTSFTNPYPQLDGVSKEKIKYKRADGVDLTGDLYLPKDMMLNVMGLCPFLSGPILLNTIRLLMPHRSVEANINSRCLTGVLLFIMSHKVMLY
ncbi:MAG: hypothetical protein WDO16_23030 [Bacteroidota bacterium]